MNRRVDIEPPPGYGPLTLLDRQHHRERGIAPHVARFATALHAAYLSLPEFAVAARTNPIVFSEAAPGTWQPLVLTGLEAGVNLCVDANGDWLPQFYCPAYVRRYPFCTARVAAGTDDQKSVICVDERGLGPAAPHLFDGRGEPTPRWRELQRFIEEIDVACRHTDEFCRRLAALHLLEPFEADINPTRGQRKRVTAMWRVVEARLNELPAEDLRSLMHGGLLALIYAHLMSLDNFHRLLTLDAARAGAV